MDFIHNYQYELLYSFGALFALFSMLSYIGPVIHASLLRDDAGMNSSEQFFNGFEGPDLSSILATDLDDDEDDDVAADQDDKNVLSLNVRTGGFRDD